MAAEVAGFDVAMPETRDQDQHGRRHDLQDMEAKEGKGFENLERPFCGGGVGSGHLLWALMERTNILQRGKTHAVVHFQCVRVCVQWQEER